METKYYHKYVNTTSAENLLKESVRQGNISEQEKNLILEYVTYRQTSRANFGDARYSKYCSKLKCAREKYLDVSWLEITVPEYLKLVSRVKNSGDKADTQKDYIIITRSFFRWLEEEGKIPAIPDLEKQLAKIQVPKTKVKKLNAAKDIFTRDEIQNLISSAKTIEEKAMFGVWYELALRPNEVAGLKWGDITPDDKGCYVNVQTTKTEYTRNIWMSLYYNYLLMWQNSTPYNKPDDFIFCDKNGKHLCHNNIDYMFRQRCKEAGCKNIPPYHIRHTRAMHLISEGMQETTLKMILEGHTDTDSIKHYITPDDEIVKNELKKLYGLQKNDEKQRPLRHNICPSCNSLNTPDSRYCRLCGTPLTDEAMEKQRVLDQAIDAVQFVDNAATKKVSDYTVEQLLELLKEKMSK